jgi:hypothetical protein
VAALDVSGRSSTILQIGHDPYSPFVAFESIQACTQSRWKLLLHPYEHHAISFVLLPVMPS